MGKLVPFSENSLSCKVKDILSFGPRNGFSPKEVEYETTYQVLKLGATSYGALDLSQTKQVDIQIEDDSHLWLKAGDILVQRGNSHVFVGSNVLINSDLEKTIYPDLMMKLRVTEVVIPQYLSLWLKSPTARNYMWQRMTGTSGTMPKISKKVVEQIPIIVPPLIDQQKLVEKVAELMALWDELLERIKQAQQTQLHLTDTMAEKVSS